MNETAVFLLDLQPAGGLAGQLRRVLETIPTLRAHIFQPREFRSSTFAEHLRRVLAEASSRVRSSCFGRRTEPRTRAGWCRS